MFASILLPETLEPEQLDDFLANGWYRMGQYLFTTHFLFFKNYFYSAVWLRTSLQGIAEDTKFIQLKKQNRAFTTEVTKAVITPQHEALYKQYRQGIKFEPSETLQSLLYGHATVNCFDSYQVNIYDGNTLIAAGFFDLGGYSGAGIVSCYHPAYKKHSLGKYLIYLKMDFCKQRGLQYFYPGYIAPGYPPFDYKTSIGRTALEYFSIATYTWLPYATFTDDTDPLKAMRKRLTDLKKLLDEKGSSNSLLYYRFFDAGLDPHYTNSSLLDYPIILQCIAHTTAAVFAVVVSDISHNRFRILQCSSVVETDWIAKADHIFSDHLLRVDKELFASGDMNEIVHKLSKLKLRSKLRSDL